MFLIVLGLAGGACFALVLDIVEPIGWWRLHWFASTNPGVDPMTLRSTSCAQPIAGLGCQADPVRRRLGTRRGDCSLAANALTLAQRPPHPAEVGVELREVGVQALDPDPSAAPKSSSFPSITSTSGASDRLTSRACA